MHNMLCICYYIITGWRWKVGFPGAMNERAARLFNNTFLPLARDCGPSDSVRPTAHVPRSA